MRILLFYIFIVVSFEWSTFNLSCHLVTRYAEYRYMKFFKADMTELLTKA